MLFTRFFYYLCGYLVISVTGPYPERFLNVCANRHILIWNVFPCAEGKLRCRISMRAFRLLPPVAHKTGVQIKILQKRGLPVWVAKSRKRKLFTLGLLLFLLCMVLVNQFVWKIDIVGSRALTADYITEKLAECGLSIGSFRPGIDEKKLQNKMLIEVPELAWLWVDKSGSKVVVQVKERVLPPAVSDPNAYNDLVAAKDGIVESMVVTAGTPMTALGSTVRKGDLLVSGLLVSDKGAEPRYVASQGEIYARVWYEKTKAFSLWSPKKHDTGRYEKKYTLALFGARLHLFRHAETKFAEYTAAEEEYELTAFGQYLGLGMHCTTYTEQETTYEKLTAESTAQNGILALQNEIDAMTAPDAVLRDSKAKTVEIDEDTVEVTVVAEYLENIAEIKMPN